MNVQCGHTAHAGLGDCPTPDDLSDVVITVPVEIRHPLSLDLAMALIGFDCDTLAYLREQWINLHGEAGSGTSGTCEVQVLLRLFEDERQRIVTEMLSEGLSIAQLARYIDVPEAAVVTALFGHDRGGRIRNVDGIVACDDELHRGSDRGQKPMARDYGITPLQVKRLASLRTEATIAA